MKTTVSRHQSIVEDSYLFKMPFSFVAVSLGALVLLGSVATRPASAQTFTAQTVLGTSVIFGAGRTGGAAGSNFGGTAPSTFTLTGGTSRVLRFGSVTGTVTFDGGNFNNADGVGSVSATNVTAFQGISGVSFAANGALPGRAGYLVGVFISGAPTGFADGSTGSTAASLAYDPTTIGFASISPVLNQTFFIGDGLTGNGTGTVQQFFVPNGATTLVLGFADAPGYNGQPGAYNDNGGVLTTSFTVSGSAAPEPGSFALMGMGLAGFGGGLGLRRRKHGAS